MPEFMMQPEGGQVGVAVGMVPASMPGFAEELTLEIVQVLRVSGVDAVPMGMPGRGAAAGGPETVELISIALASASLMWQVGRDAMAAMRERSKRRLTRVRSSYSATVEVLFVCSSDESGRSAVREVINRVARVEEIIEDRYGGNWIRLILSGDVENRQGIRSVWVEMDGWDASAETQVKVQKALDSLDDSDASHVLRVDRAAFGRVRVRVDPDVVHR